VSWPKGVCSGVVTIYLLDSEAMPEPDWFWPLEPTSHIVNFNICQMKVFETKGSSKVLFLCTCIVIILFTRFVYVTNQSHVETFVSFTMYLKASLNNWS
jgi:hypothetical protein